MKYCAKCKTYKPESSFSKDASKKSGFDCRCKACRKEFQQNNREYLHTYQKKWREDNPEKYQEIEHKKEERKRAVRIRNNVFSLKRRSSCSLTFQEILNKIKKQGCCVCGYDACIDALEFHHLDPSKKEMAINKISTITRLNKELQHCILVCANCHREIHREMIEVSSLPPAIKQVSHV